MAKIWAGSTRYTQVATYADLPIAGLYPGEIFVVLTTTGIWPFQKNKGMYRSDGMDWVYITDGGSWGTITGTLSSQTDLQNTLNAKQDTLVSGTNIKTINNASLLGSGNINVSGGGSPSNEITITAGETMSAYRVVYIKPSDGKAYLATNTNIDTVVNICGITTQAVVGGDDVTIQASGLMTYSEWNWNTSGERVLFLSTAGQLTQTPPTSAVWFPVGFVTLDNRIFIKLREPITRT